MNCFTRTLLIALFLSFYLPVDAQYFSDLEKQIPKHINGFDRAILCYTIGRAMPREFHIKGYGVKGNNLFYLELIFKEEGKYPNIKRVFKSINKSIEKNKSTIDSIKAIPFSSVYEFNEDSLNYENPYGWHISDGSTDIIFVMTGNKHCNKLSYMPELYQSSWPTNDRADFIKIKNKLLALLKK